MRDTPKMRAIALRRKGKTYAEILETVPVAKSTLSLWLREVGLSTPQKQRITRARVEGALRGAAARRNNRIAQVHSLRVQGKKEVGSISDRELWLLGIALYWAEGSKQRETATSTGVIFSNSDPDMLKLFMVWLKAQGVPMSDIAFELYVHADRVSEINAFKKWWQKKLALSSKDIQSVYVKRGNVHTNRKNVADLYHGQIRIKVRRSTSLNRRIQGWIEGVATSV